MCKGRQQRSRQCNLWLLSLHAKHAPHGGRGMRRFVCDELDGRFARMLDQSSTFGVVLDMVTDRCARKKRCALLPSNVANLDSPDT